MLDVLGAGAENAGNPSAFRFFDSALGIGLTSGPLNASVLP